MSVINTNLAAVIAQNAVRASEGLSSQSMERLSTGLRINSAKDDAAGLAISTRMTSAIRGLGASLKNASNGISLAQTADGALGDISNVLQRLRELAVQSANASYNNTDRSFLDSEASGLVAEVARIASQANFNNTKLLDGSFAAKVFQLGFEASDSMLFNGIDDARAISLGTHVLTMDAVAAGNGLGSVKAASTTATMTSNGVTGNATNRLTTATGGTSAAFTIAAGDSAKTIANTINTIASDIGIVATATNAATLSGLANAGNISFTLTGSNALGSSIVASITSTSDLTSLAAAINAASSSTGISASFSNPLVKSNLLLTSNDGSNIKVSNFLNSGGGNLTFGEGPVEIAGGTLATTTLVSGGNDASIKTGIVKLISSKGLITVSGGDTTAFASATQTSNLASVQNISVSTQYAASSALSVIDNALSQVNNSRANLGAAINRFETSISNQSNAIMNISASRSRILDADYAKETSQLAKSMIIQQAATAMLGQANQNPRLVLHLLK